MKIGIYEKALPIDLNWHDRLMMASRSGFDYVEMSIDESDQRLSRLDWTQSKIIEIRNAISNTNVPIMSMCLSAHRKYSLGSLRREVMMRGLEIFEKAISLAAKIGIRIIQVNGYDVFYESSSEETKAIFIENMRKGVQWADDNGIMLGLENVDTPFVDSIEKALHVVQKLSSSRFQLYPDIGNLQAAGYDPPSELNRGKNHLIAIHIKDSLPGIVRGVEFGKGDVPFKAVFRELAKIGYKGPFTIEMWSDPSNDEDPIASIVAAREFVQYQLDRSVMRN
jgi:L-ribulose-5-phosphate 3-epimerase/hexulose-6-phosphate isomerase